MDGWPLNIFKWFTAGSKSLQIFSQFAFLYYVYCTGTGIFYSRCTVRVGANDLYTVILFFWMNKSFLSFKKIDFVCINFCVSGSSVDISRDKMLFGFSLTLTSSRLMLLPKTSFVGVFFLSFSLSLSLAYCGRRKVSLVQTEEKWQSVIHATACFCYRTAVDGTKRKNNSAVDIQDHLALPSML